jgi:hypothetical protein
MRGGVLNYKLGSAIRAYRRSSVANNNPEKYWLNATQTKLATDEH